MDKKIAKIVQDECAAALKAIAEKHGMTVLPNGGTIGEIDMILKFKFKTADTAAIVASERAEFDAYCGIFGLEPQDYGAKFNANGKTYTVVGLSLNRRKYPIIVADETGKRTLFTDMVVDRIKLVRQVSA